VQKGYFHSFLQKLNSATTLYMAKMHVHIVAYVMSYTDTNMIQVYIYRYTCMYVCIYIFSIVICSAGANVRQQHSLRHRITLYFDVQLQWAAIDQQATICIHSADNHNWMAQQAVESSLEGQQIHTVQVIMQLLPPIALASVIAVMKPEHAIQAPS